MPSIAQMLKAGAKSLEGELNFGAEDKHSNIRISYRVTCFYVPQAAQR
jgi:hypothetical protein